MFKFQKLRLKGDMSWSPRQLNEVAKKKEIVEKGWLVDWMVLWHVYLMPKSVYSLSDYFIKNNYWL